MKTIMDLWNERHNLDAHDLRDLRDEWREFADDLANKKNLSDAEIKEARAIPGRLDELDEMIRRKEAKEKQHADKALTVGRNLIERPDFQKHAQRVGHRGDFSLGEFLYGQVVGRDDRQKRAITSTSGSALIPTDYVKGTLFDALSINPLGALGVEFISPEQGSKWPRVTTYPTTNWVASQGSQVSLDSALTIGSVNVDYKDLAVRMRIQNQVLLDSVIDPAQVLQAAAEMAINDALLDAVFHADGSGGKPTGLDSLSGTNTVAGGSVVLGDYAEIRAGVYQLLKDNVRMENIGMAAHPVIWLQLSGLEDTTGQPLQKPMDIDRMPMQFTSAIDINQGAGTDTTIYLGDWSQLKIAAAGPYRYVTDNAQDYLQTEIILWLRVDFAFLQPDHFCLIKNVAQGTTT